MQIYRRSIWPCVLVLTHVSDWITLARITNGDLFLLLFFPQVWILEGELPKGATGKIDKKGLRDLYTKEVLARKQTSSL